VLAQQLVEKRGFEAHDPMRTARMGAYGGGKTCFSPLPPCAKKKKKKKKKKKSPSCPREIRELLRRTRKDKVLIGMCVVIFGPAATKWYGFLTKHVNLKSKNGTILARVACDQLAFAPVNMGMFLLNPTFFFFLCYISYLPSTPFIPPADLKY
jgi:protein Mpv17